jgi:hypothetical protein
MFRLNSRTTAAYAAGTSSGATIPRRADRRNAEGRQLLVQRVTAEFHEMPCLRVTAAEAQRLFGLRPDVCTRLVNELIGCGVVRVDADGRYAASGISEVAVRDRT